MADAIAGHDCLVLVENRAVGCVDLVAIGPGLSHALVTAATDPADIVTLMTQMGLAKQPAAL
jgi:hypothetical protein